MSVKNLAELNELIETKERSEAGEAPAAVASDAVQETEVKADSQEEPITQTPAGASEAPETVAEATPEWTPNYKFKAFDQEKEIPDWAKTSFKFDKDNEKQILETFTKAESFDPMKAERDQYKSQVQQILPEFQNYKASIDYLTQVAQEKDITAAMKLLGWSNQDLANHFLQMKQLEEMSPLQQQEYMRMQQAREENRTLKHKLSDFEIRQQNTAFTQHQTELKNTLSHPSNKPLIDQYEAENGQGSFNGLMEMIGQNHYYKTNEYLPVGEAFKQAMKFARLSPAQQQASGMPATAPSAPATVQKKPPAPMPNIGKSTKAAGTPVPKASVKAMKEKLNQLIAQGE